MKFDDLYNRVFIREQDETEVADPTSPDFNDVEPAPLPQPSQQPTDGEETQVSAGPEPDFDSYIMECTKLANMLVSSDGSDLLSTLSKLDRPLTAHEGVYDSFKSGILRASEALSDLASQMLAYKNNPKRGA
jgi:hypothetical protein